MHGISIGVTIVGALALQGCIAKTAANIVTAPVRVASSAVDAVTTSQSERDEKRGREIRKREERLGRLQRRYENQLEDCQDGDRRACRDAQDTYAEIQILLPTIPAPPPEDD